MKQQTDNTQDNKVGSHQVTGDELKVIESEAEKFYPFPDGNFSDEIYQRINTQLTAFENGAIVFSEKLKAENENLLKQLNAESDYQALQRDEIAHLKEDNRLLVDAAKKALIIMKRVDENFGYFPETAQLEAAINHVIKPQIK